MKLAVRAFCGLSLLLAARARAQAPAFAGGGVAAPGFAALRYDDNPSVATWHVQEPGLAAFFGGEARVQFVQRWDDAFGAVPGYDGSLQERFLLHASVRPVPGFRVFAQLLSAWEHGKKPRALPIDVDHLDPQQLFAEWDGSGAAAGDYLRVGRQEMLLGGHELLKVREGANVRLAFDGARAHLVLCDYTADLFATTAVQPKPGVFDDGWFDRTTEFSGVNAGWRPRGLPWHADLFYFDTRQRRLRYEDVAGPENRQTIGIRADGTSGPWEFDYEVSDQFGTVGGEKIQAWGAALFTRYRFRTLPGVPKGTLGFSYVTGDRSGADRTLNTFNVLFARADYFGDTDLLTGSNTVDLSGAVEANPAPRTSLRAQWDWLWRSSAADGLYAPPLILIRPAIAGASRFIGEQGTVAVTQTVNRFLTAQVVGAVFLVGSFLKASEPSRDTESVTWRLQYKF